VPVLVEPSAESRVTPVHLEPLTVALIICVVVLSVVALTLAGILCRRCRVAEQQLVVIDEDNDSSSASLRTRLSPLHSNLLFADKVSSGTALEPWS